MTVAFDIADELNALKTEVLSLRADYARLASAAQTAGRRQYGLKRTKLRPRSKRKRTRSRRRPATPAKRSPRILMSFDAWWSPMQVKPRRSSRRTRCPCWPARRQSPFCWAE